MVSVNEHVVGAGGGPNNDGSGAYVDVFGGDESNPSYAHLGHFGVIEYSAPGDELFHLYVVSIAEDSAQPV